MDVLSFVPRNKITESGFIKSRHLDNKAGVISILSTGKYLVDNSIKSNEFFAIDTNALGEGETSDEFSVAICAKDS